MNFFSHRAKKNKPIQKKPSSIKATKSNRLSLESLELRVNPTDLVVSPLLFRGDLIAEGALWKATGSPVELGFHPTQGEAFRSLVRLAGDTIVDPALQNFQFQGAGSVPGTNGRLDFWSSTVLSTFDIQGLVGSRASITGKAFPLGDLIATATTLTLENPNDGDTSDSQLKLEGSGTLSFNGAASPLELSALVVTVTSAEAGNASGNATGNFLAEGTHWTLTNNPMSANIIGGKSVVTVTGNARSELRTDTLTMQLESAKNPANGLIIEGGAIKTLEATVTAQPFTIAGTPIELTGQFNLTNTALEFKGKGDHTGKLGFMGYSDFQFSIENAKLSALTAYATTPWLNTIAAAGLFFSVLPIPGIISLSANLEAKLTLESGIETLSITGHAGFTLDDKDWRNRNSVVLTVTAAGKGWVIQNGILQEYDIQVDGRVDIFSFTFEARATRIWYSANDPVYGKDTYGFSGSLFLMLGGERSFKDKTGKTVATEPSNPVELNCGTKQSPGFVWTKSESGSELRLVNVGLSIKEFRAGKPKKGTGGELDFAGLKFRLTNAGLYYKANAGTTDYTWGLYGILATDLGLTGKSTNGKSSMGLASASFGTRENPGVLIRTFQDPETLEWGTRYELRDFTIKWTDFRLAGVGFNHVELSYQIPDKTKPNEAFWSGKLEIAVGDMYAGASLKLKQVTDATTGITTTFFDGFTVSKGVDPTGDSDGFPLGASGAFLIRMEAGVENWQDPDRWAFVGTMVIGFGKRIPYFDSDNKDALTGAYKDRKAYPCVLAGTLRVFPKSLKVSGAVDIYVGAYWDKMAGASFQTQWKSLLGSGKGTIVIDPLNDNYRVDFSGNMFQLVNATFQFILKNGELLLYANVQVKPTPYGIWDFWPVSRIDISGSLFLLLAERQRVFSVWTQLKILGFNGTLGVGYDFLKGETFWVTSAGKVNELIKIKDTFLNPTSGFKYMQTYPAKAEQGSTALHSSRYTVSIPFVTTKVSINGVLYANPLTSDDIQVILPTTPGTAVNALPLGTSYTYRVEMGETKGLSRIGSIIVDIFPNAGKKTDFTKTFASLGIDKLMVDIKVGLKQNSLFFLPGESESDYKSYVDTIVTSPSIYLNGIDTTQMGESQFTNAVWDTTKQINVNNKSYPILPAQQDIFTVVQPSVNVLNHNLVTREINSYTNTTDFTFTANTSSQTQNNGLLSLLVLEEAEITASRWTIQRTGDWSTEVAGNSNYSYSAEAWVVEKNVFDQSDLKNQKVETPFTETASTEVLFFNSDRVPQVGVGKVVGSSVTIVSEGGTFNIPPDQVKSLWERKAQVRLLSKTGGGAIGDVFTATLIPTGYVQQPSLNPLNETTNYFEAFRADSPVILGQMPPLPAGMIPPEMLKLPTLPNFVQGQMDLEGEMQSNGKNFFPIDASTKLTTLRQGSALGLANYGLPQKFCNTTPEI